MLLHESINMEQNVPENLSIQNVFSSCEMKLPSTCSTQSCLESESLASASTTKAQLNPASTASPASATKVKLSFSVDRLLSADNRSAAAPEQSESFPAQRQCCDSNVYACCAIPNCFAAVPTVAAPEGPRTPTAAAYAYAMDKFHPSLYMNYKSILRPTPIRAHLSAGSTNESATTFPTLATNALLRFHQQQQQQHKPMATATSPTALLAPPPLNSLRTLQLTQQQRFHSKTQQLLDITTASVPATANGSSNSSSTNASNCNGNNGSSGGGVGGKRKRSWSRAVFTNLQRKGLEIQFQQQKYITKPDRRKLAARLNLTDAQVKVWFQNRRMKWRHTRENLKSGQEKPPAMLPVKPAMSTGLSIAPQLDYSSESCSSVALSEPAENDNEDEEDIDNIEIDVVE